MISFIVCSVSKERSEALHQNLLSKIGDSFEFISIDNGVSPRSIASVYNDGASKARGNVLCFVHEDVAFHSGGWGKTIEEKALEENCGVIGFIGSWYKSKTYSGWSTDEKTDVGTFIQGGIHARKYERGNTKLDFEPCIVADGFCLFVSKAKWAEHPFDEVLIKSFHVYDIDFCLTLADDGMKNYVCHCILAEHFSMGGFGAEWIKATESLHLKWQDKLPMFVGKELTDDEIENLEERARYRFCKLILKSDYPIRNASRLIKQTYLEDKAPIVQLRLQMKLLYYRLLRLLT